MRYCAGIEDLVANVFVERLTVKGSSQVSFSELHTYGEMVVKLMEENGCRAILILSRDRTGAFMCDCSDYFEIVEDAAIRLKDGKTLEEPKTVFRSETSFQVLKACMGPRSLEALGIVA